jgi:hypothetical protein
METTEDTAFVELVVIHQELLKLLDILVELVELAALLKY